ncbi:MAG: RNA polymerase sigma factor [Christensenellaceae bacterium]|nr:RNA polymerase sigma factor [Christensenellaceae bacterium]
MTHTAFAERIIAMQARLYRVSAGILNQRADQEDAVQSCIEKAWRKLPTLRDESSLEAWVTRILINECRAMIRRKRWVVPVETIPDAPAPPDADPDLYRFFASLPDKLRLVMTLHYVEGFEVTEIARLLRLPEGTIKSRLARGREKMKADENLWEEVNEL